MMIRFKKIPQRFILSLTFTAIAALIVGGALTGVKAQTQEDRIAELQRQIEALEQQATQYRSNIAGERAKAASLQREIGVLKNEILSLETQITLTGKKIDKTEVEIGDLTDSIADTEVSIARQKETVGRLVLFLDQRDSEDLVSVLMKNDSLSEFFRQAEYAQDLTTQLISVVNDLKRTRERLAADRTDLESRQSELEQLNQERTARRNSLTTVKSSQDTLLRRTKGQEVEYQKMLVEVENKRNAFFQELQQLENKVIAGGLFIVHITAAKVPPKGTKLFQWPEDGYRLTQGYGMTSYAKRGAYGGAPHNGVDIAGGFSTPIKAMADGTVAANGTNDGFGNWVAIRHTNDLVSVYSHFSAFASLAVVGTSVKAGEVIGYEGSTGNSTGSHLHISVYRDFFTYVNSKKNQLYFNYFEGSLNPLDYL